MKVFADRLYEAIRERRTPVMVGLDPRYDLLPGQLRPTGSQAGLSVRAAACAEFCRGVIDVVAPLVPIVKPQAAFFEEIGPPGVVALGQTIQYAQTKGLLVVVSLVGKLLKRRYPETTPGMIQEIPPYAVPTLHAFLAQEGLGWAACCRSDHAQQRKR